MEKEIDALEIDFIETNQFQTTINEELKASLNLEVWEELIKFVTRVEFIKRLISPNRGTIADRPVDTEFYNDGRKAIDVTNPHFLENMDYFRERAKFFEKNKRYTNIPPNSNPKSEYAKFWREELRRFKDGVIRDDGEWIPGKLYYYWNYGRLYISETIQGRQAKRGKGFPNTWLGDYLFFHYVDQCEVRGKHGKNLKCRGIGASFKASNMTPCNMFVHQGTGNGNFHLANENAYLEGDKGIYGKILDNLDFMSENTPFPRLRLVDDRRKMFLQLGYKDKYGVRKGPLSYVNAISLKDNPDKARGLRGKFCHYEEDGIFDNLEKAWNVNRESFEDGDQTFGLMFAMGTGGVEGASFEGSEKLFYSPDAYNIHSIPNVFDLDANGSSSCAHFWGSYLNRNGCYELKNGEPDVVLALIQVITERIKTKYSSQDMNTIIQRKAEKCITPQEAIMRTLGTVFPVNELSEYLQSIMTQRDRFYAEHHVGDLIYDANGSVLFRDNLNISPLRRYDIGKDDDRTGAVEIYQMPNDKKPWGRYIGGCDPVDAEQGPSLISIVIMDTFTDKIVAEYSARPRHINDAYDICLKLCKFYNAEVNYERNLKGLFSYFDKHNSLQYLADQPQILRDMDMVKTTGYGNTSKGTIATNRINAFARQLQAEWMIQKPETADAEDTRLNLHYLRSTAYIEECIKWHADGNFDRVSSHGMLFILREDKYKRTQFIKSHDYEDKSYLGNDPFFERNYRRAKKHAMELRNSYSELNNLN